MRKGTVVVSTSARALMFSVSLFLLFGIFAAVVEGQGLEEQDTFAVSDQVMQQDLVVDTGSDLPPLSAPTHDSSTIGIVDSTSESLSDGSDFPWEGELLDDGDFSHEQLLLQNDGIDVDSQDGQLVTDAARGQELLSSIGIVGVEQISSDSFELSFEGSSDQMYTLSIYKDSALVYSGSLNIPPPSLPFQLDAVEAGTEILVLLFDATHNVVAEYRHYVENLAPEIVSVDASVTSGTVQLDLDIADSTNDQLYLAASFPGSLSSAQESASPLPDVILPFRAVAGGLSTITLPIDVRAHYEDTYYPLTIAISDGDFVSLREVLLFVPATDMSSQDQATLPPPLPSDFDDVDFANISGTNTTNTSSDTGGAAAGVAGDGAAGDGASGDGAGDDGDGDGDGDDDGPGPGPVGVPGPTYPPSDPTLTAVDALTMTDASFSDCPLPDVLAVDENDNADILTVTVEESPFLHLYTERYRTCAVQDPQLLSANGAFDLSWQSPVFKAACNSLDSSEQIFNVRDDVQADGVTVTKYDLAVSTSISALDQRNLALYKLACVSKQTTSQGQTYFSSLLSDWTLGLQDIPLRASSKEHISVLPGDSSVYSTYSVQDVLDGIISRPLNKAALSDAFKIEFEDASLPANDSAKYMSLVYFDTAVLRSDFDDLVKLPSVQISTGAHDLQSRTAVILNIHEEFPVLGTGNGLTKAWTGAGLVPDDFSCWNAHYLTVDGHVLKTGETVASYDGTISSFSLQDGVLEFFPRICAGTSSPISSGIHSGVGP